MKDKCIDCENTYNPNNDYCIRCGFEDAKKAFWDEIEKTKLYKWMISFVDWLSNVLSR